MNSQLILRRHNNNHPRTHPEMHSGTALTVQRTVNDDPFATLTIDGKSEQAYVSPSSNLFNGIFINAFISPVTMNSGTRMVVVPCVPNTTFVISRNIAGTRFSAGYTKQYPTSGTAVFGIITANTATNITITTGADALYLVAYVYNSSFDTAIPVCWVTKSATPQAYVSFVPESPSLLYPAAISSTNNFDLISTDDADRTQTIHFAYTLRSLPSGVKDKIIVDNIAKTSKHIKRIEETIFTGNRTWTFAQVLSGFSRFYTFAGAKVGTSNDAINVMCDKLKAVSWNDPSRGTTNNIHSYNGDTRIGIVISNSFTGILDADTSQQKVDKLVAYLNTNNLTVRYEIEPIETAITYAAVQTYFDETQVYTNAAVQPTLTGTFRVLGV